MQTTSPKHRHVATACMVLLLVFSVGIASAKTANAAIIGTVVCHDGNPLEGLEVALFEDYDFGLAAAVDVAHTDAIGAFVLEAEPGETAVLQISGEGGAGRVRLRPESEEPLRIAYPVRKKIALLHDNDMHFDFNQRDEFKAAVQEARERYDAAFLLNAGDIFVRHPHRWIDEDGNKRDVVWYAERAMRIIAIMNEIGYDAMVAGNHEMDFVGPYTGAALGAARFPVLAANFRITTDKLPAMPPFAILRTDTGRTVAVLGIATGSPQAGVQRLNPNETVMVHLRLRNEHDVFIALTHIGINGDRRLAERFPAFDVIIGGHSHTLLEEGARVGQVLIAQAGGSGHTTSRQRPKYLGKVLLTMENGAIVEKQASVKVFRPEADDGE